MVAMYNELKYEFMKKRKKTHTLEILNTQVHREFQMINLSKKRKAKIQMKIKTVEYCNLKKEKLTK